MKIDWTTFARTFGCLGFSTHGGLHVTWISWGWYTPLPELLSLWMVETAVKDGP